MTSLGQVKLKWLAQPGFAFKLQFPIADIIGEMGIQLFK